MKPTPDARRGKKKVSILTQEKIEYIDWKDINLLRRFVSDRAKIRARRVTGNSAQQQRDVAMAIKNAREMALLPYKNLITTQRGGRGGGRPVRDLSGQASGSRRGEFESLIGPLNATSLVYVHRFPCCPLHLFVALTAAVRP